MSQIDKKQSRLRRSKKLRMRVKRQGICRLTVHRTLRHTYAQVISADGTKTIASASTLDEDVRSECSYGSNCKAAEMVGKLVAQRALQAKVSKVAFDRSGFKYHGRIKALAESARAGGMQF